MRIFLRIFSSVLVLAGAGFLLSAVLPILQYEIRAGKGLRQEDLLSPLVKSYSAVAKTDFDLTQASNWFVGAPELPAAPSKVAYYNLSIDKLRIKQAAVEIGGEDLSKNLIHYEGTAFPGRPGNAVIFGHSILPQFYNPENYLSVFSLLPTLKTGDIVRVDYDGITYRYQVEQMFEVKPEDIEILAQRYDASYLTLVTCVPPGTYLRRLVVRAKLITPS